MKQRILLLALFLPVSLLSAQSLKIRGSVSDGQTERELEGVTIELLAAKDSSLITRTVSTKGKTIPSLDVVFRFNYELEVLRDSSYILCYSMLGRKTQYKNISVRLPKNMDVWMLDDVLMAEDDVKALREVVVEATRIKMVMRGDTLVYNANAFSLSEGSMLDELIRQLPGARLKGGVITINGRRVSSLLVDGRRFFSGDPKLALQRLPAYTVDKVKVYDHAGEASRLMGRDMGDAEYVVDVNLKKQYKQGLSGAADLAGGTHDRHFENLELLGFDKKNKFLLRGSFGNTGRSRLADLTNSNSDFSGKGEPRDGQIEGAYQRQGKTFDDRFSANFGLQHNELHKQIRTSRQTFLTGGDTYGLSNSDQHEKNTGINGHITWGKRLSKHILGATLRYGNSRGEAHDLSRSALFGANPDWADDLLDSLFQTRIGKRLRDISINRVGRELLNRSQTNTWQLFFRDRIGIGKGNSNFGNMLTISADMSHTSSKSFGYGLNRYDFFSGGNRQDHRNEYREQPDKTNQLEINASYGRRLTKKDDLRNSLFINFDYDLMHRHQTNENSLFRLDQLAAYDEDRYPLGHLPSSRDELKAVLDAGNSDRSLSRTTRNRFVLRPKYLRSKGKNSPKITLEAHLPLNFIYEKLDFFRQKPHEKSRNSLLFNPILTAEISRIDSTGTRRLKFSYIGSQNQPHLKSLLDIRSDADPLYIKQGNPKLKKAFSHKFDLQYITTSMRVYHPSLSITASYRLDRDALVTVLSYDKASGVTTSQPGNINGNWNADVNIQYSQSLDRNDRFMLSSVLLSSYRNSVDLTRVAGEPAQLQSRVGSFDNSLIALLLWQPTLNVSFSFTSMAYNRIAKGNRKDFTTVNAWEFDQSLSVMAQLPWGLELKTYFSYLKRMGYNDTRMNTGQRMLNAGISKTLLKKKLSIALRAYDLLNDVNPVVFTLDEQGRSEQWTNSIPRFVMLHVTYKFTGGMKQQSYR